MTNPVQVIRDRHSKQNRAYPTHKMVANWVFDEQEQEEAALTNYMAAVAEKSGMDANDLIHLVPAVLRMLKSDCAWAK